MSSVVLRESLLTRFTGLVLPRMPGLPVFKRDQAPAEAEKVQEKLAELAEKQAKEMPESFFHDNGILRAVPKKKVSHQKKREKLYGPERKQLKMINHLNKCPSCGHYKRANTLCMYCVGQIRHLWKSKVQNVAKEPAQEQELSELDKRILYPSKKETAYEKQLKKKDEYLEKRPRTLPFEKK